MSYLPRLVLCAATAFLLFAGFQYVRGHWFGGQSVWDVIDDAFRIADEYRRRDELAERTEAIRHCSDCKEKVVAEVVAGRMKLAAAAREFGLLNEKTYGRADRYPEVWKVASEEEGLCLSVLAWVRSDLQDQPSQAAEVLSRLQVEFHEHCKAKSEK
jgi:hypothetical protein